jgi:heme/copper-type cytochrome/quinol oxidase subunit 2
VDALATPAPSGGAATPVPSGAVPGESLPPAGDVIKEAALNVAYVNGELAAPADVPFKIEFDNQDAGIPHNIEIKDATGATVFKGDIITGPAKITYEVQPLKAGTYPFVCTVHPNMTGSLKVGS